MVVAAINLRRISSPQQTSRDEAFWLYEIEEGREVDRLLHERSENLGNLSINSCSIFKVNVALRESNPDAYTPKMISIGPYHKENPELRSMEKYKKLYLQRFLKRKEGIIDVEDCTRELEQLKDEALKCYDDDDDIDVGGFSEMLLLDGCFVVEYIRENWEMEDVDRLIKAGCIDNQIRRDLLLLENQLPFFVLTKLHGMTKNDQDTIPFTEMVMEAFSYSVPKMVPASFLATEGNVKNIKHLLQVVHMSCQPLERTVTPPGSKHKDNLTIQREDDMPNATELCEAGVTFFKVGNIYRLSDSTSLFDIKFEKGLMEIPCFQITDLTETILRNLIAYEQHSPDIKVRYFSDFSLFMTYLIRSDKDANLLRQKGIIKNWLGEDNEVARIFNKLGQGVYITSNFYYRDECRKAVEHCGKPWNRMQAWLRRNWAGISSVAAITFLSLTFIQTALTFFSVLK